MKYKQEILLKFLTDKKYHDDILMQNNDESKFLKKFDDSTIKMFIRGHNSKRRLRFSTILKKSYLYITNNNKSLIEEYFNNYPYYGQRPQKDIENFLKFISNDINYKYLFELMSHEFNIYLVSTNKRKYIIQSYETLIDIGIKNDYYIYIRDYNLHKIMMKPITRNVVRVINEYGINNANTIEYLSENDLKLLKILRR